MTRLLLLACALLPACAGKVAPVPTAEAETSWRAIATPADRDRLARWRDAWVTATAQVRRGSQADVLRAEPALFAFDTALDRPLPPPGDYRCRVFKLGSPSSAGLDYVSYPWFVCRVGGASGAVDFVKLTGSQRQIGRLYPARDHRAVFLGTLALGDETGALAYGRDRDRDVAGWVERIGPARWRLAMPYPRYESLIDVMELVPVS